MQFSLVELVKTMGPFALAIVIVMVFMSIASLVVAAERMLVFRKSNQQSRAFASKMAAAFGKGDLQSALTQPLEKEGGHIGRVINAGLVAYKTSRPGDRDVAVESVARALERQSQREVQSLKRGLGMLATVGSTAPFVGLLGTVVGIVNSFQSMAASGSGGLGTVSAGISEALVTTAFGLVVAIPAVMLYNFLQGWVDSRAVDISESANEFLDLVARNVQGHAATPHLPVT